MTAQPSRRRARPILTSRALLAPIFATQYAALARLRSARLSCNQCRPCQKSPSQKTASFSRGKTISGFPGRSTRWVWNRRPTPRRARCNSRSCAVFVLRFAFLARELPGEDGSKPSKLGARCDKPRHESFGCDRTGARLPLDLIPNQLVAIEPPVRCADVSRRPKPAGVSGGFSEGKLLQHARLTEHSSTREVLIGGRANQASADLAGSEDFAQTLGAAQFKVLHLRERNLRADGLAAGVAGVHLRLRTRLKIPVPGHDQEVWHAEAMVAPPGPEKQKRASPYASRAS